MSFVNKYKWLQPGLLFTFALLLGRIVYAQRLTFIFIPWNLFLAALPLYFAFKLQSSGARGIKAWVLIALWLLFFPNSMYIVTDLFHLRQHGNVPLWYDLLILVSAAITGIIMGFASLRQVERFLMAKVSVRYMRWIVLFIFMLCGYGIYIGRYLRWNSWDIVTQPFALLSDMLYHIAHPLRSIECWMLTILFGIWMYLLYSYFSKHARRSENAATQ